jgi:hypothetical protein
MQALSGQAIAELRAMESAMRADDPATGPTRLDDRPGGRRAPRDHDAAAGRLGRWRCGRRPQQAVPRRRPSTSCRIATEAVHNCVNARRPAREVR